TPEEQKLVISTGLAMENVLAVRGVAGMGAGSDMMRAAIQRTVPGGQSANRDFALKQIDAIDNMINQLQQGQPQVGNLTPPRPVLTDGGAAPVAKAAPRNGSTLDMNNATGLKDFNTGQFRQFDDSEKSIYASGQDLIAKMTRDPKM